MKAITLTQPWATLVAIGAKRFETRSWNTSYRGILAIHSAKVFPKWARDICLMQPFVQILIEHNYAQAYNHGEPMRLWPDEQPLPLGEVIAICRLNSTCPTGSAREAFGLSDMEIAFGDYSPGRWAWELIDVQPIEPVPAKGALGLWECGITWNT